MVRIGKHFRTLVHCARKGAAATAMVACLTSTALVAGCSSDDVATAFPPYHYENLSQIHLNVATLRVADNAPPGLISGDESGRAPIPPDQALTQMAQERLIATGSAGSAVFTIDRASIVHEPGGTLAGQMDVHLEMLSPIGQRSGEAEAHITRQMKPDLSKGDADSSANLYELTREMMEDMNSELELQIRRNLKDWIVDASGMPPASAIQSESLGGTAQNAADGAKAAAPAVVPSAVGTDSATPAKTGASDATPAKIVRSSAPDAIFPGGAPDAAADASATTSGQRSPATGFLKAPTH